MKLAQIWLNFDWNWSSNQVFIWKISIFLKNLGKISWFTCNYYVFNFRRFFKQIYYEKRSIFDPTLSRWLTALKCFKTAENFWRYFHKPTLQSLKFSAKNNNFKVLFGPENCQSLTIFSLVNFEFLGTTFLIRKVLTLETQF